MAADLAKKFKACRDQPAGWETGSMAARSRNSISDGDGGIVAIKVDVCPYEVCGALDVWWATA
jgi:hypothetical protein